MVVVLPQILYMYSLLLHNNQPLSEVGQTRNFVRDSLVLGMMRILPITIVLTHSVSYGNQISVVAHIAKTNMLQMIQQRMTIQQYGKLILMAQLLLELHS